MVMVKNQSLGRRIVSGGAWAIVGRFGASVLVLGTNAVLARMLDQSSYGQYFLLSSLVVISASLAQLGVNQTLVRFIASGDNSGQSGSVKDFVNAAYIVVMLGATATASILVVGFKYYSIESINFSEVELSTALLAWWMAVLALQSLTAEVFRGVQGFRLSAIFGGLTSAAILLGGLIAARGFGFGVSLAEVVTWTAVALTASNLLSVFFIKRIFQDGICSKGKSKLFAVIAEIVQNSWPVLLATAATFILTQADIWIIGHYLSSRDVAIYSAASKLAQTCMLITSLSYAVLPPFIVACLSENRTNQLQELVQKGASACSFAVLPLACMMLITPGALLEFMYGSSYREAEGILVPIAIGLVFNTLTGMRGYLLILSGNQKTQLLIAMTNGAINIGACVVAVQEFGREGVAWAVCFSMIFGCIVEMVVVKKFLNVWTYATLDEAKSIIRYLLMRLKV